MNYRILFSHYSLVDGGDACGFTRSIALAIGLANLGHDITFITMQRNTYKFPFKIYNRGNVKVYAFFEIFPYRFRKSGIGPISTFLKCIFILFKKFDIVHSDMGHRPASGLPCLLHRYLFKSIYISEWWEYFGIGGIYDDMPKWHKETIGRFDNIFEIKNKLCADGVVAISHELVRKAVNHGVKINNITILNGGSDTEKILFYESNNNYKKIFNLDKNLSWIGLVGFNKTEIENQNIILKAIVKINSDEEKIGIFTTGSILSYDEIIELGFTTRLFRQFGWIDYSEYSKLLSCADAFSIVLKNNLRNNARYPNKLGDYIAAGKPIIANPVGEVKYYIDKYPEVFYKVDEYAVDHVEYLILKLYNKIRTNNIDHRMIRNIAIENSWQNRATELSVFYNSIFVNSCKK